MISSKLAMKYLPCMLPHPVIVVDIRDVLLEFHNSFFSSFKLIWLLLCRFDCGWMIGENGNDENLNFIKKKEDCEGRETYFYLKKQPKKHLNLLHFRHFTRNMRLEKVKKIICQKWKHYFLIKTFCKNSITVNTLSLSHTKPSLI